MDIQCKSCNSTFEIEEQNADSATECPACNSSANLNSRPSDKAAVDSKKSEKVPPLIHIACGWPLIMVGFGGAIGGGLGGAAYAINMNIYKSSLAPVLKVILNIASGALAFILWLTIVQMLLK